MARGRKRKEVGYAETIECTKCLQLKIRIVSGLYENGRTIFVDQNGKTWNGFTCGDCNPIRVKMYMRKHLRDDIKRLHAHQAKRS